MISVPHLLLLTGTSPDIVGGGAIFLRDLCLSYPRKKLNCFTVEESSYHAPDSNDLNWLPIYRCCCLNPRNLKFGGGLINHIYKKLVFWHLRRTRIPIITKELHQYCHDNQVEMIWAVLNNPAVIQVAKRLLSSTNIPLVTTVWDPPEYLSKARNLDRSTQRIVQSNFGFLLKKSLRCSVMSENMLETYTKKYGIIPVILRHGLFRNGFQDTDVRRNSNQIVIGFAGNFYAQETWKALLRALSEVKWMIAGRRVIIRILNRNAPQFTKGIENIEYLGWKSIKESISIISKTDITYLPYWFNKKHSLSVQLCFPSKLSLYVAAGRPVLYHGPYNSSPTRFFKKYPLGLECNSLSSNKILDALTKLALDNELNKSSEDACTNAYDLELSSRVFRQRFAELIGIDANELIASDESH